ncbi:hypothetical protein E3P99_02376 [Wallemia hederae]|uniref:Post-GPI attachment to proteins factor 3 n=1 Tax=Wallemia hederae TaxID=1540922 RepID=A0A4T0FMY5_9BASI|nr:hypothetical protein E3P99_02376 [Wallemia hederae]
MRLYTTIHFLAMSWVRTPMHQYYGKWPFYRFMGVQEPFSVLFSLLNLLAHRSGMRDVRVRLPTHPNYPSYIIFAAVNILAWLASSLFHTRDTPLTERLDYVCAGAAVTSGLNLAITRVFDVHWKKSSGILAAAYLFHILTVLSSQRIDYGWHMAIVIAAGMAHNAIWVWFSLRDWVGKLLYAQSHINSRSHTHPAQYTPLLLVTLTTAALSLELLEFEPLFRAIDAHSLWHASTFPLAIHWYSWLITDAEWSMSGKSALDKELEA